MAGRSMRWAFSFAGLALLGLGLLLSLEDPASWAAWALLAAGAGLVVAGHGLPAPVPLPAPLVAGVGVVLTVGVILHGALTAAPFDVRRVLLAGLGVALQIVAPFTDRTLRVARRREMPVSSLVAAALALVGTPLALWALLSGLAVA